MIKYALVASGSKGNCCVVKNCDTSIIIDCGCTQKYLKTSFERLQYDYHKSEGVFITHTHSDHIQSLSMFKHLDVYASATLQLEDYHKLRAYDVVQLNTLQVTSIPTSHDAKDSCGYVIKSDSETLVYLTDTGYISDQIKDYMRNADYYIFESNHDLEMLMNTSRPPFIKQRIAGDYGHLCNEDSAAVLSELVGDRTKEIVLAHISEEGNTKELAKQRLLEAFEKKGINYTIHIICAPQFDIVRGGSSSI